MNKIKKCLHCGKLKKFDAGDVVLVQKAVIDLERKWKDLLGGPMMSPAITREAKGVSGHFTFILNGLKKIQGLLK